MLGSLPWAVVVAFRLLGGGVEGLQTKRKEVRGGVIDQLMLSSVWESLLPAGWARGGGRCNLRSQ